MRSQVVTFSISVGSYSIELCVSFEPQLHSIFFLIFSSIYLSVCFSVLCAWATSNDSWVQEAGGDGGSKGREKEEENNTKGKIVRFFKTTDKNKILT